MDGVSDGFEGELFFELTDGLFSFFGYWLLCDVMESLRESGCVAGGIEYAACAVAGHHSEGENIGEDGDAAAGHGFADGDAAAFVVGAGDDIVGGVEPVFHCFVWSFSYEGDLPAGAGCGAEEGVDLRQEVAGMEEHVEAGAGAMLSEEEEGVEDGQGIFI